MSTENQNTECEACKEWEQSFEIQYAAAQRGIKMWQQTTGRKNVWPDTAALELYLMLRIEKAEQILDIVREMGKLTLPESGMSEESALCLEAVISVHGYDREYMEAADD